MSSTIVREHGSVPDGCLETAAPIRQVTIAEDHAQVRRETPLQWGKGPTTVLISGVSPAVIDSTLWAQVTPEEGLAAPEIGSARLVRWYARRHESGTKETALVASLESLYRKIGLLARRRERLAGLEAEMEAASPLAARSVVERIVFCGARPESYGALIDDLLKGAARNCEERVAVHRERKDLERELRELGWEWSRHTMEANAVFRQAGILVTFDAADAGKGTLRCGYGVPCAQWRPQHEAHLGGDETVTFLTHGVVWQNTGEDWDKVALTLSTAKPSLGLDAVLPDEDVLQLREKTKIEKKRVRVAMREETIQRTGLADVGETEPPLPSDGGEAQHYAVEGAVTIPSNGRPFMVELGRFALAAETAFTAYPELSPSVFLLSHMKNPGSRPVLAGPVELHRAGTYVGRGSVEFVASNEAFRLWWGAEDFLSVERYVDEKEEDLPLGGGKRKTFTVTHRMRNLSGEPYELLVRERIPVSELEQVRIRMLGTPDLSCAPDANGFVSIPASLGPGEDKTFAFSWTMELGNEVDFA